MEPIKIEFLQNACVNGHVLWSVHVLVRIQERGIYRKDAVNAILTGEIIEQYPEDKPYPSCLILGESTRGEPLHVVAALSESNATMITAYYPTPDKFFEDNRTRKERTT